MNIRHLTDIELQITELEKYKQRSATWSKQDELKLLTLDKLYIERELLLEELEEETKFKHKMPWYDENY